MSRSKMTLMGATLMSVAMAGVSVAGTIEGTASYRERIAVLPETTLYVELQDVSLADAPSVTLASKRYALTGIPAPFELSYDDALIKENMSYVVRATIFNGDKMLMTTDTAYPVLTRGGGNSVDLVLVQASSPQPVELENTKWSAIGIDGETIETDRRPEIEFAEGGAFGGSGGCNRFSGQADISGDMLTFPDNMAATLMACPPPMEDMEKQFFGALQRVASFAVAGDSLVFLDAAGAPVLKFVRAAQ